MENNILSTTIKLLNITDGTRHAYKTASNEGVTDIFKSLKGVFSTKLSSIRSAFTTNKDRVEEYTIDPKKLNVFARELASKKKLILDIVQTVNYSNIEGMNTPTVPGLQVTYIEAAKELENILTKSKKYIKDNIEPLNKLISNILADEDNRTSSRPVSINKTSEKDEKFLRDKLNKLLSSKEAVDIKKFKYMYPNLRSLKDTYDILTNIAIGTNLKELQELNKYCVDIDLKIEAMVQEIERGELVISKPLLEKLSIDLENTANIVTLLASFTELYNKMVNSMKLLISIMEDKYQDYA